MKTSILVLAMTMMTLTGVAQQNPLLTDYGTPFETPPFDRIKNEHFMPAFREAMEQESKEVDAIVANQATADVPEHDRSPGQKRHPVGPGPQRVLHPAGS